MSCPGKVCFQRCVCVCVFSWPVHLCAPNGFLLTTCQGRFVHPMCWCIFGWSCMQSLEGPLHNIYMHNVWIHGNHKKVCMTVDIWEHTWHLQRCVLTFLCYALHESVWIHAYMMSLHIIFIWPCLCTYARPCEFICECIHLCSLWLWTYSVVVHAVCDCVFVICVLCKFQSCRMWTHARP